MESLSSVEILPGCLLIDRTSALQSVDFFANGSTFFELVPNMFGLNIRLDRIPDQLLGVCAVEPVLSLLACWCVVTVLAAPLHVNSPVEIFLDSKEGTAVKPLPLRSKLTGVLKNGTSAGLLGRILPPLPER